MQLFSRWQNSAGERVRIALNLKGIAYDYIPVASLPEGEYLRLNPQGLLPALRVDGEVFAQSGAILEYLEETHPDPALLPADPILRAQARAFGQLIACDLHPLTTIRARKVLAEGPIGADEAAVSAWLHHWLKTAFTSLEAALASRKQAWAYCFGDAPGWADLHLAPQFANAQRAGLDLTPYPLLSAVYARCHELDAFRKARPDAQPDAPS